MHSPSGRSVDGGRLRAASGVAICALALLAFGVREALRGPNSDTYFHLRFGHEFLTAWSPWAPGSVTSVATRPWVPTQWAGQVLFALAESAGGLRGVMMLTTFLVTTFLAGLIVVLTRDVSLMTASALAITVAFACIPSLSPRPQLFSYIFAVVTIAAWLGTLTDARLRWWLIPLTWCWALLHGMWPVGVAVGLTACAGMSIEDPADRTHRQSWWIPLGSLAAAGLTPVGPRLYEAVLLVNDRAHYFSEWSPTDFTAPAGATLALLLSAALLVRLRQGTDRWTADLLLLGTLGAALYSSRTLPIAAAFSAILLARQVNRPTPLRANRTAKPSHTLSIVTVAVLALGASTLVLSQRDIPAPDSSTGPVAQALARLPAHTAVFTPIDLGGYLMWAYPDLDPVFNGYADAYTDRELSDLFTIEAAGPQWQVLLDDLQVQHLLLPVGSALAYNAERDDGWQVDANDDSLMLLSRR